MKEIDRFCFLAVSRKQGPISLHVSVCETVLELGFVFIYSNMAARVLAEIGFQ